MLYSLSTTDFNRLEATQRMGELPRGIVFGCFPLSFYILSKLFLPSADQTVYVTLLYSIEILTHAKEGMPLHDNFNEALFPQVVPPSG